MTLDRGDLGAHADGENLPDSDPLIRAHDWDLPIRMNLKFQEPVRAFSLNHVSAIREVPQSNTVVDVEVTIAMDRSEAKTWIEQQMMLRYMGRRSWKRRLPRKYVMLEVGDAVLLPDKGDELLDPVFFRQSRVVQKAVGANGVVELTFMDHFFHEKVSAVTAADIIDAGVSMPPGSSPTYPYMLDCPLIFDSDPDAPGYYVVLTGSSGGWSGGQLFVDLENAASVSAFGETAALPSAGTNYFPVATQYQQVAHGFATVPPMTNKHETCFDRESKVLVLLYNPLLILNTITPLQAVMQTVNMCMIGNEIIQYCNAVNKGNGVWELSMLIRGVRGTEYAIPSHQPGERFVALTLGGFQRLSHDASVLNVSETYKAASFNDDLSTISPFTFTDTGNSLRPRAPQIWQAYKDSSNNRYLVWNPRARQHNGWLDGSATALDQPVEQYQIDVIQGGTVKNTYSFTSARSWTYSAGAQSTDGVSSGSAINFNLYEISPVIGRGFVTSVTV
jgi:hypothetical protein